MSERRLIPFDDSRLAGPEYAGLRRAGREVRARTGATLYVNPRGTRGEIVFGVPHAGMAGGVALFGLPDIPLYRPFGTGVTQFQAGSDYFHVGSRRTPLPCTADEVVRLINACRNASESDKRRWARQREDTEGRAAEERAGRAFEDEIYPEIERRTRFMLAPSISTVVGGFPR